jgi:hypothetical protein
MNFPETQNLSINCCGHPVYQILTKSEEKVDNRATFPLGFHVKYRFHCTDFHKIHNSLRELCGNFLYQVSPKSAKKCGNYGQKFIYALKHESAVLIFMKFTPARQLSVNNPYTAFY